METMMRLQVIAERFQIQYRPLTISMLIQARFSTEAEELSPLCFAVATAMIFWTMTPLSGQSMKRKMADHRWTVYHQSSSNPQKD
jgi:hypothetical protein